jgi:hypothetical protein
MAERLPLHRLAQIIGHDSLDTMMVYVRGGLTDGEAVVRQHLLGPRHPLPYDVPVRRQADGLLEEPREVLGG